MDYLFDIEMGGAEFWRDKAELRPRREIYQGVRGDLLASGLSVRDAERIARKVVAYDSR
jgi:hypothetical protein